MSSGQRKWTFRLRHIIDAAERIQGYVAGMTYAQFASDQRTVDAVFRSLMVMGEATRYVPDRVIAHYPYVPWEQLRGMRNVLAHEYDRINLAVVWNAIQTEIPPLVPMLRDVLASEGSDEP